MNGLKRALSQKVAEYVELKQRERHEKISSNVVDWQSSNKIYKQSRRIEHR